MGYLLLTILFSSLLVVLFREFGRYRRLSLLPVITVNYLVCVAVGVMLQPDYFAQLWAPPRGWITVAAGIGLLFIGLFFLIGTASQRLGVTFTIVMIKLSVVIPTLVSIVAFNDAMDGLRWTGVGAALVATLLLNWRPRRPPGAGLGRSALSWQLIVLLSLVLFLGSGTTDTLFKLFQARFAGQVERPVFVITLFGVAGLSGAIVSAVQLLRGKLRPVWGDLLAGTVLGLPNYFSIFFLTLALKTLPGTIFFPVNNIGQIVLTSLAGMLLYRERLSRYGWAGFALALLAIGLISHGKLARFAAYVFS